MFVFGDCKNIKFSGALRQLYLHVNNKHKYFVTLSQKAHDGEKTLLYLRMDTVSISKIYNMHSD